MELSRDTVLELKQAGLMVVYDTEVDAMLSKLMKCTSGNFAHEVNGCIGYLNGVSKMNTLLRERHDG